MKTRSCLVAAAAAVLVIPVISSPGACDSYIQINTGNYYGCGNEVWTYRQTFFSTWIWIDPGADGVKGASFRLEGCSSLINIYTEYAPGILALGNVTGDGVEISVDPCRTEPFLVCRLDWFSLSQESCWTRLVETSDGHFSDVSCSDETGPMLDWGGLYFNTWSCMCGGAPMPSSCRQTGPDELRVVFRYLPTQIDCGEDYSHFRVVFKHDEIAPYPELGIAAADFDSFNCDYCNMCDSIVAVFTLESPLDDSYEYDFCIDGYGRECCTCGGLRYLPIERLIPVATLLQESSAEFVPGGIELRWTLSGRADGAVFTVERAAGGGDFERLEADPAYAGGESYLFVDSGVRPGGSYSYRVLVDDEDGSRILFEAGPVDVPDVPLAVSNHPNPFNPSTVVDFSLPESGRVLVGIYDVSGRLVRKLVDRDMEAGAHSLEWDGRGGDGAVMPSGIYFCRLRMGKSEISSKLVLLR